MSTLRLVALLLPGALLSTDASGQARASTPTAAPTYRGFSPGAAYRDFAERARRVARQRGDQLVCNTSRRTAQLMECGVVIRDPSDSATFYLSAYVLEGKVAMLSFGDSGGVRLVERLKRDVRARFGPPRSTGIGTWEWRFGGEGAARVVRFNWRGRGSIRWVYITLWDDVVMGRISRYVRRLP